jgi:hypothetical protein
MNGFGPQNQFAERTGERPAPVQVLVEEAGIEIAQIRASTVALKPLDRNEWDRTQKLARSIAARRKPWSFQFW